MIGSVAPAQAIVPESHITAPGDPAYLFENNAPSSTFTVVGTANVPEVDLRCYDGLTPTSYSTIVEKVPVTSGAFSVSAPISKLPSQPCVLRAVPTGDTEAHPPGQGAPYAGPRALRSSFEIFTKSSVAYDYEQEFLTLDAYLGVDSVGDEGLYYSYLFAPGTLAKSESGFYNNASLQTEDRPASGAATRSEVQVDGKDAYAPDGAKQLGEHLGSGVIPGSPSVTASTTETAPGEFVVQESDPFVMCTGKAPAVFPPTKESCEEFVSTGVQLNRTWQSAHGDRVALLTDSWVSTDGATHHLSALYDQESSQNGTEGAFEFPGESSFSAVSAGQAKSLPGDSAIYYKTDAATPDGGDLTNPQLAIVYDTQPSGGLVAFHQASVGKRPIFEMPYERTITPSSPFKLRMGFVTEYELGAVRTLANEVLASYPPSVSIASPANGAVVNASTVTVTGSATDTGAVASVTVNGHSATLASNGSWSVSVPLSPGANTLSALATDQAGLTAGKSVTVTYAPVQPVAQAVQVGNASGVNGKVTFKVACKGLPGQKCTIAGTLTTREKLRGSKLLAISAKHRKRSKTRTKTVTVGAKTVTIPAGQTVTITITLNSTGRKLLSRFHKLPVHLSAVLVVGKTKSTVIAQNLTIKPPKPKNQHKRKHHKG
ncbi:MAG TPA: Ig-like domain-containing protein [Solirubrobacteraceae bacterium]|jgi:hypothetical protein